MERIYLGAISFINHSNKILNYIRCIIIQSHSFTTRQDLQALQDFSSNEDSKPRSRQE